ncbi:MAG TPA: hypothetical protein VES67_14605 [Vicinamibacterales bacterium]|nr:hypothetical protein [Vicinamibacterales bacterium]
MNTRRSPAIRRLAHILLAAGVIASLTPAGGCDKVALVAPTGSELTLVATAASVPADGSIEITAVIFEGGYGPGSGQNSGTAITPGIGEPVRDGTNVAFVTTLGRFESAVATTTDGKATVKFFGDGRAGTAKVTGVSGPASATIDILITATGATSR